GSDSRCGSDGGGTARENIGSGVETARHGSRGGSGDGIQTGARAASSTPGPCMSLQAIVHLFQEAGLLTADGAAGTTAAERAAALPAGVLRSIALAAGGGGAARPAECLDYGGFCRVLRTAAEAVYGDSAGARHRLVTEHVLPAFRQRLQAGAAAAAAAVTAAAASAAAIAEPRMAPVDRKTRRRSSTGAVAAACHPAERPPLRQEVQLLKQDRRRETPSNGRGPSDGRNEGNLAAAPESVAAPSDADFVGGSTILRPPEPPPTSPPQPPAFSTSGRGMAAMYPPPPPHNWGQAAEESTTASFALSGEGGQGSRVHSGRRPSRAICADDQGAAGNRISHRSHDWRGGSDGDGKGMNESAGEGAYSRDLGVGRPAAVAVAGTGNANWRTRRATQKQGSGGREADHSSAGGVETGVVASSQFVPLVAPASPMRDLAVPSLPSSPSTPPHSMLGGRREEALVPPGGVVLSQLDQKVLSVFNPYLRALRDLHTRYATTSSVVYGECCHGSTAGGNDGGAAGGGGGGGGESCHICIGSDRMVPALDKSSFLRLATDLSLVPQLITAQAAADHFVASCAAAAWRQPGSFTRQGSAGACGAGGGNGSQNARRGEPRREPPPAMTFPAFLACIYSCSMDLAAAATAAASPPHGHHHSHHHHPDSSASSLIVASRGVMFPPPRRRQRRATTGQPRARTDMAAAAAAAAAALANTAPTPREKLHRLLSRLDPSHKWMRVRPPRLLGLRREDAMWTIFTTYASHYPLAGPPKQPRGTAAAAAAADGILGASTHEPFRLSMPALLQFAADFSLIFGGGSKSAGAGAGAGGGDGGSCGGGSGGGGDG
ncbi:unnamed protein product, partial [Phaeothamnion confervicola]